MAQSSERTRLLSNEQARPHYIFESSLSERKRRVRQFQCCACAIILCFVLVIVIASIAYSIAHDAIDTENSTDTSIINDVTPLTSTLVLLRAAMPLQDEIVTDTTIDNDLYSKAALQAEEDLKKKNEIEKQILPLKLRSPSYRHQKVVYTVERGRNLSRMGYLEEYATKYLGRNGNKVATNERICQKTYPFSKDYCENKSVRCSHFQKFRSYNGTCNNLKFPTMYGVAYRPFRRMLPPIYSDGISQPRIAKDGSNLPSARTVSTIVHRPFYRSEDKFTVMLAVWGQFLDHDITATALSQKSNGSTISCCDNKGVTSPECFPVMLDSDDPYQEYNMSCIEFVRSAPAPTCCLGPREQMNQVTSFIDGSMVYGVDEDLVISLRELKKGAMKVFVTDDGRALLPQSNDTNDGCNQEVEEKEGRYCFKTGDGRANENLHLTTMHLLWVRQHNLIAEAFSEINPTWNDEQIFQQTRRLVGAQIQHITYNEFLPVLLGKELMDEFDLFPQKSGYCNSYNDSVDPNIANNFAAAAFRFAHSIIPGLMKFIATQDNTTEYVQLHKMLFNPFTLYSPGSLDGTLRGAMNTTTQASDVYFTDELKSHLFERSTEIKYPKMCGLDLVSLNIQRGRDHGLRTYPSWRQHCGFGRPKTFLDLEGIMDPKSLYNIRIIYSDVEDIDLYTGLLSEIPLESSFLGPTITCLILDQFYRLKHGDRFWYENSGPHGFSLDQINEIRKTSLANVICDTSDNIDVIQPKVMESLGEHNPYVNCSDIDKPNLKYWKEELHVQKLSKNSDNINMLHERNMN